LSEKITSGDAYPNRQVIPVALVMERLESVAEDFGLTVPQWLRLSWALLPERYADRPEPEEPSVHPPGSPERVEEMRLRAKARKSLYHPADRPDHEALESERAKPKPGLLRLSIPAVSHAYELDEDL
jgi:hypothetical protein